MPDSKIPDNPSSEDLADTRTAWAEDRTMLANERTFAGWMRTGMACIGLALGFRALFSDTAYPLVAKGVALSFIAAAILIFWAAATKARQTQKRMDSHDVREQSHQRMTLLAVILTIAAILTGSVLAFL